MNTEITVTDDSKGWIFFDANCPLCANSAARTNRFLKRHGFRLVPLQTPGTAERLRLAPGELLTQMRLLMPTGQCLGGADALVEIARHIWWAKPVISLAGLPGAMPVLRCFYARLAAKRHCLGGVCKTHHLRRMRRVFFEMP